jgi:hypothetical protein
MVFTMRNGIAMALFAFLLGACSTNESVHPGRSTDVVVSDIVTPVKIMEYEADLSKKIEGVAEGYFSKSANLDYYKEQAIAKACAQANVDFLIDPVFTITNKAGVVSVKVTGYPAKYTELRNAVPEDSIHFKFVKGLGQMQTRSKGQFKLIY